MAEGTIRRYVDPHAEDLLDGKGARRLLLLDRDGVINHDHGYVHLESQTEWMEGIFDFVACARSEGWQALVVTNQAGIARGFYTEAQFLAYTAWVHEEFRRRGVPLLATFYCPHHPEYGVPPWKRSCICRKPAPGMIVAALRDFGCVPAGAMLLGDKDSDLEAARAAGLSKLVKVTGNAIPAWAEATRAWLERPFEPLN